MIVLKFWYQFNTKKMCEELIEKLNLAWFNWYLARFKMWLDISFFF